MSIYSRNESGTKAYHSRFTKSISNTMRYDCRFHELVPVLKRFVLPGDVWKIGGEALVRFQPMVSPSMTPYSYRVRYFFVPLRLLDENTELIITGSKDGKLYESTLPEFPNFVAHANKVSHPNAYKVTKYSFWDYMNVQIGDYESIKSNKCLPAEYWLKGYVRIFWDYYRDENYTADVGGNNDFETLFSNVASNGCNYPLLTSELSKDYFTSSLPWQLKGTAPLLNVIGNSDVEFNFTDAVKQEGQKVAYNDLLTLNYDGNIPSGLSEAGSFGTSSDGNPFVKYDSVDYTDTQAVEKVDNFSDNLKRALSNANFSGGTIGFTADELRTMMAQTRIFERLARCGSRYTEYLRSNFGTSPLDDTLQRAQYLGGWKIPVVTTEVLQTAADGSTPVGTMRGHGITRGGNFIKTFFAKEFGLLFGIAEIRPQVEYTTGIPRQFTYKSRFDFFNPSFQHLSEQEVLNGELFVSDSDGKNDDTLGFQAYGNELRSYNNEVVADMRDSLSYWGSSLHFSSRPNLQGLLLAGNHMSSFNAPFAVSSDTARPVIVNFYNNLDVYRPMVKYSTPGLVDHL